MVPADDQAMALPCTSVIVIIVLLNDAFTWATPEAMFLRSRRRTRTASLPILNPFATAAAEPQMCTITSSCLRSPWQDPCGCGRSWGFAGPGPGGRADAATHGSSQDPSAAL